jgi:hypothetical protein
MSFLLRHSPFREQANEAIVGLERVAIHEHQIIAWVSLTAQTVMELPPHAPRFPAILDTGHGHNLSIHERHLSDWARLTRGDLPVRGRSRVNGVETFLHAASVWIHPNRPGERDQLIESAPICLDIREGIDIRPGAVAPRLPLLGLRALVRNKLFLTVDADRCLAGLHTANWRTKLMRLLS